jgi:exopolyphosphatase/guanosine-5'-triphosphate,3'-diphosphate pyrophosphatase
MNVAVVDIGSNSTRLLIARRQGDQITELVRRSRVTRLGAGVDGAGRLAEASMERVYAVLDDDAQEIATHDCAAAVAVLTSAVRDSVNGAEFADTIRRRFAIEPHVLTGEQEAQLTYLGATSERDPADATPTLVLDIGGGSTELVIGAGRDVSFHVSTQAGVVRQTERHLHDDPPTANQIQALRDDVATILDAAIPDRLRSAVTHAVAVAGTATSLAAIAQRLDPYDPARVHGYRLSATDGDRILAELSAMTLTQRREVPGLHPDRAPTILAGVLIFNEVVRRFGLREIEISEHDILRGAALGLIA